MTELTDLELLRAIRARLLEYGHTTGVFGGLDGPNCVAGAAYIVLHNEDPMRFFALKFHTILERLFPPSVRGNAAVTAWNDTVGCDRVLATLDWLIAEHEVNERAEASRDLLQPA